MSAVVGDPGLAPGTDAGVRGAGPGGAPAPGTAAAATGTGATSQELRTQSQAALGKGAEQCRAAPEPRPRNWGAERASGVDQLGPRRARGIGAERASGVGPRHARGIGAEARPRNWGLARLGWPSNWGRGAPEELGPGGAPEEVGASAPGGAEQCRGTPWGPGSAAARPRIGAFWIISGPEQGAVDLGRESSRGIAQGRKSAG